MIDDALLGTHKVDTATAMTALGEQLGSLLEAGDLVVLTGPLGAGKTTLTRGIGAGLGVRGPVQSPTFVIARTHPSLVGGAPLVHVDAYRLGSSAELDDLDVDVDGSVVIVEWGRDMAEGLRERWWEIEIERPVAAGTPDIITTDLDTADLDGDAPRRITISRRP